MDSKIRLGKRIPVISTRGFYDLSNGNVLRKSRYCIFPKKFFEKLYDVPEITIMVHGLRNDRSDALNKFQIAKKRLKQLGYKHPVMGFSYDANVKGAQYKRTEFQALRVGQKIAKKNGKHLAEFILDFKKAHANKKIRLIGHSLGTQVIFYALDTLAKKKENTKIVEQVYFFGSSLELTEIKPSQIHKILKIIFKGLINYYSPYDEVLQYAVDNNQLKEPIGLNGITKNFYKIKQKKVYPKNHRFLSYSKTLKKFP